MNHKIKKNIRALTGLLVLIIALTFPAVLGNGTETEAGILSGEEAGEEAHISPGDAEDLLFLEEDIVSRRMSKTPGLNLQSEEAQQVDGTWPVENPEDFLMEKALRMEERKAKIEEKKKEADRQEAARKEAARKEAARKEAEKKAAQTQAEAETQEQTVLQGDPQTTPAANSQFLIQIDQPDPNYRGRPLQVSDRQALEGLVMGEYGNDYLGAVLVAQCIRDSMVKEGTNSAAVIKKRYGYTAPIKRNVSDTVKQAVAFVFDEGGSGVQHAIYYFYASNLVRGKWHETQKFVVQRQAVRFFSPYQ